MTSVSAELSRLSVDELLRRFEEAPAPTMDEMAGDYRARLLRQPGPLTSAGGRLLLGLPFMPWRSKAFRPLDESSGRGYNSFGPDRRVIRRFPMRTQIAPSRFDGKPAFTLIYAAYRSACGRIRMVDEVRRIEPHLYLGIGTCGFSERRRMVPLPFLLEKGPGPYLGDIGTEIPGFEPGPAELPALFVSRPAERQPS